VLRTSLRWLTRTSAAFVLCAALAQAASACPMCNQSIAAEDRLPRAYMVSILFMLGMPATIFTTAGLAIYFKVRKFQAEQLALANQAAEFPTADNGGPAGTPAPIV